MTNFTAASGNTLGLAIMGDNRIGMIEITAPYGGGYFFHRFRPVVERKTSIEIFTKMLTDQNAGVEA